MIDQRTLRMANRWDSDQLGGELQQVGHETGPDGSAGGRSVPDSLGGGAQLGDEGGLWVGVCGGGTQPGAEFP